MKRSVVAAALLACLLSASVAAALQVKHSRADTALARRALLATGDLDPGWTASGKPGGAPALTCDRFNPSLGGVVESGAVASPRFEQGSSGPFLSQSVYVYATRSQAMIVANKVIRPRLIDCLAESVTRGSGRGVRFTVRSKEPIALPRFGDRDAGYRVVADETSPGQSATAVVDLLMLARGRAVTAISVSGFDQPLPRATEVRLVRAAADRLRRTRGL